MDESSDFNIGVIFSFILVIVLNVLFEVQDGVYPVDFQQALDSCATAGGVDKVYRTEYIGKRFRVLCTDGREVWLTTQSKASK